MLQTETETGSADIARDAGGSEGRGRRGETEEGQLLQLQTEEEGRIGGKGQPGRKRSHNAEEELLGKTEMLQEEGGWEQGLLLAAEEEAEVGEEDGQHLERTRSQAVSAIGRTAGRIFICNQLFRSRCSKLACKNFFRKAFCIDRCCRRKGDDDQLSRRESVLSQKKSLSSTVPPPQEVSVVVDI